MKTEQLNSFTCDSVLLIKFFHLDFIGWLFVGARAGAGVAGGDGTGAAGGAGADAADIEEGDLCWIVILTNLNVGWDRWRVTGDLLSRCCVS